MVFPAHLDVNVNGEFPAKRIAHKMVLINSSVRRAGQFDGGKLSGLKPVKYIFNYFPLSAIVWKCQVASDFASLSWWNKFLKNVCYRKDRRACLRPRRAKQPINGGEK